MIIGTTKYSPRRAAENPHQLTTSLQLNQHSETLSSILFLVIKKKEKEKVRIIISRFFFFFLLIRAAIDLDLIGQRRSLKMTKECVVPIEELHNSQAVENVVLPKQKKAKTKLSNRRNKSDADEEFLKKMTRKYRVDKTLTKLYCRRYKQYSDKKL